MSMDAPEFHGPQTRGRSPGGRGRLPGAIDVPTPALPAEPQRSRDYPSGLARNAAVSWVRSRRFGRNPAKQERAETESSPSLMQQSDKLIGRQIHLRLATLARAVASNLQVGRLVSVPRKRQRSFGLTATTTEGALPEHRLTNGVTDRPCRDPRCAGDDASAHVSDTMVVSVRSPAAAGECHDGGRAARPSSRRRTRSSPLRCGGS